MSWGSLMEIWVTPEWAIPDSVEGQVQSSRGALHPDPDLRTGTTILPSPGGLSWGFWMLAFQGVPFPSPSPTGAWCEDNLGLIHAQATPGSGGLRRVRAGSARPLLKPLYRSLTPCGLPRLASPGSGASAEFSGDP